MDFIVLALCLGCFVGMAISIKVAHQVTIDSMIFNETRAVTADQVACKIEKSIPGAKSGSLTTRTDDTTGTLTMVTGHGLTTGAKVSLFWAGGRRYNVTLGTVATDSVPITNSGAGDNLPTQGTAIRVCVEVEFSTDIVGDRLRAYAFFAPKRGTVQLVAGTTVEKVEDTVGDNQEQDWTYGGTEVNPIVGDTITKVRLSHEDTSAQIMKFSAAVNQA